ncbi:hypothetical protein L7F22_050215 [Adiantum nelumboides]|nr:hypothetical protein [Adiantum nelumboides]
MEAKSSSFSEWLHIREDFKEPLSANSSLPALYADLAAHRSSNKASFEASVEWWRKLLYSACMEGVLSGPNSSSLTTKGKEPEISTTDRLTLHVNQALLDGLTVDEVGRPLGLGTVIMELQQKKEIVERKQFLSSRTPFKRPSLGSSSRVSPALSSRAASLAMAPLTWAISQLSLSLGFGESSSDASEEDWEKSKGNWVVLENVEMVAEAILAAHHSSPRLSALDCLFSRRTFIEELVKPAFAATVSDSSLAKPSPSESDLEVLLKYLARDRRVALVDKEVIKLELERGTIETDSKISEHERGIVDVRDTHAKVEKQIEEIEKRIKERQSKVEKCLKENSRSQALSYLRSRKTLEALLEKRVGTLETLHGVLVKIEQAASDVEIMKAYETSTASLKTLLGDARLQPDRIDANMDEMQETLANADEVRQAIDLGAQGMRQASGVEEPDEAEMEAELLALQKEVETEKRDESDKHDAQKAQDTLHNAPVPPQNNTGQQSTSVAESNPVSKEAIAES